MVAGNEGTLSDAIIAAIILSTITLIGALCAPIITVIVGYKCKLLKQQLSTVKHTYTHTCLHACSACVLYYGSVVTYVAHLVLKQGSGYISLTMHACMHTFYRHLIVTNVCTSYVISPLICSICQLFFRHFHNFIFLY